MSRTSSLAPLLERFFTQRLMQQRQASPHTISSYRDTFRQFLTFAQERLDRPPSSLNAAGRCTPARPARPRLRCGQVNAMHPTTRRAPS